MYEQPRFDIILTTVDVIRTSDPTPNPNPDDGEIDWG